MICCVLLHSAICCAAVTRLVHPPRALPLSYGPGSAGDQQRYKERARAAVPKLNSAESAWARLACATERRQNFTLRCSPVMRLLCLWILVRIRRNVQGSSGIAVISRDCHTHFRLGRRDFHASGSGCITAAGTGGDAGGAPAGVVAIQVHRIECFVPCLWPRPGLCRWKAEAPIRCLALGHDCFSWLCVFQLPLRHSGCVRDCTEGVSPHVGGWKP